MYWFCGVNDYSQMHKTLYLAALISAKKNTSLKPILLYDGNDEDFCNKVELFGSNIVKHVTSFSNKENFIKKNVNWKGTACGAFLRIDIPLICDKLNIKDPTVLYTDTDVIFLKDVVSDLQTYTPEYFAICPQFIKTNYEEFNSGVMLLNVKTMLETYNEFSNFMESKDYDFSAFDQGAFWDFYKDKSEKLPLEFNHKPYWGIDDNAKIIHYHGPKYDNIINYFNGTEKEHIKKEYAHIFNMVDDNMWKYYLNLYESYTNI
jgi:hypothetical protein